MSLSSSISERRQHQQQEQPPPSGGGSRLYRSVTDDYRMSSVYLASQVHKAIRDGDYAWLQDLIENTSCEIVWEANCSGWTALHYAASHFLPLEWWRWILEKACAGCWPDGTAQERFYSARNDLGETVFDIFFRSFLAPFPWQSTQVKNCSNYLLHAMDHVCGEERLLRETRELLRGPFFNSEQSTGHSFSELHFPSSTSISVVRCFRFCRNLQVLCEAAQTGKLGRGKDDEEKPYTFEEVIEFLIRTAGGFPEPFARLALALYPQQAKTPRSGESYLLHLWGASFTCCRFMNGIQRPLIEACPQAASTADSTGRFPLHHAFLSGKSWQDLEPLFEADPSLLECVDPVTRLFPFALLALAPSGSLATSKNEMIQIRARQGSAGDKGLVSLWYIMPKESRKESIRRATAELDCECLTSIYLALRAFPRALPETIKVQTRLRLRGSLS